VLSLVLSLALAFTPSHAAAKTSGTHASGFPTRGALVPGKSIAGVSLGTPQARVKQLWGSRYELCSYCKVTTWFYEYPTGEPLGAAVKFDKAGKVVSVFTLGSPIGWGMRGAMTFDPITNIYNVYPNPTQTSCIGYVALWWRVNATTTMSFYTASGVIYGFAITAPSEKVCQ